MRRIRGRPTCLAVAPPASPRPSGPACREPDGARVMRDPAPPPCRGHMSTIPVGYFVGSLARASINRKLATALTRLAPPELEMREIPIGDLPLYSYDYDADFPPPARALKDA